MRSLPGIAYALSTEGRPVPVPPDLVEQVRVRALWENDRDRRRRFNPGDRVQIASGPFQGLEAAFDRRLSASGRSRVLINLVSRLVPVEIDESKLVSVR